MHHNDQFTNPDAIVYYFLRLLSKCMDDEIVERLDTQIKNIARIDWVDEAQALLHFRQSPQHLLINRWLPGEKTVARLRIEDRLGEENSIHFDAAQGTIKKIWADRPFRSLHKDEIRRICYECFTDNVDGKCLCRA